MLKNLNKLSDNKNAQIVYLQERQDCYKNLKIVFNNKTKFKDRINITKYLCEKRSYITESFFCLLMIFYLIPITPEAKEYFQDISELYLQVCKYFSKSDYFQFFTIQTAKFLCKFPLGGELKYFNLTNSFC